MKKVNRFPIMSNHKPNLIFSLEAETDLWSILQYSLEIWGEKQANIYNKRLNDAFLLIQDNPYIGRQRDDIMSKYHILTIEKHHIIYWPEEERITIIRILHVNQDITEYFEM